MVPSTLAALTELGRLAEESQAPELAAEAGRWLERVRQGSFYVACLGQFKRGKSTLLNALLEQPGLLPVGIPPTTSVVTVLRQGPPAARVRRAQADWQGFPLGEVAGIASEEGNPENRLGVTGLELFCPSPLLEGGLCLVDTPGIGSVFEGNTRETERFVPHVDAALVVLGGDPPISAQELELLRTVSAQVQDVALVLNKADRLSPEELQAAARFTRSQLGEQWPLFLVSALKTGPEDEWKALRDWLLRLGQRAGLAQQAGERGRELVERALSQHLASERQALTRSCEEAQRHLEQLRKAVLAAELGADQLSYRFKADRERLRRQFQQDRQAFLDASKPADPRAAVLAWRDELEPRAEQRFAELTARFTEEANALLAALPAELPPLEPETRLKARSGFHFLDLIREQRPSLLERLRSRPEERARAFSRRLLEVNANRVVGDLDDRILESWRAVEGALRRRLSLLVQVATRAVDRAEQVRRGGQEALEARLAQLDCWEGRLRCGHLQE